MADIESNGKQWFYTDIVKDHFMRPRNILLDDSQIKQMNGMGEVGSPACGDIIQLWIKVDEKSGKITDTKWKTFGCASAISSTSMLSIMLTENGGMHIDEAEKLTAKDILERLHGLPPKKIHCSVLGDQALKIAIKNYRESKK